MLNKTGLAGRSAHPCAPAQRAPVVVCEERLCGAGSLGYFSCPSREATRLPVRDPVVQLGYRHLCAGTPCRAERQRQPRDPSPEQIAATRGRSDQRRPPIAVRLAAICQMPRAHHGRCRALARRRKAAPIKANHAELGSGTAIAICGSRYCPVANAAMISF